MAIASTMRLTASMHVRQQTSTPDRKVAFVKGHGMQDKGLAPVQRARSSGSTTTINGSVLTRPLRHSRNLPKARKDSSAGSLFVSYPIVNNLVTSVSRCKLFGLFAPQNDVIHPAELRQRLCRRRLLSESSAARLPSVAGSCQRVVSTKAYCVHDCCVSRKQREVIDSNVLETTS